MKKEEILEPNFLMFEYKGLPMFGYQHPIFDNLIFVREDHDTANTVISKDAVYSLRPAKVVPTDVVWIERENRSRCENCSKPLRRTYTDFDEELSFEDLVFCNWECAEEWVSKGQEPVSDKYVPIDKENLLRIKYMLMEYWKDLGKEYWSTLGSNRLQEVEKLLTDVFPNEVTFMQA